jgi:hypothetical protein
MGEVFSENYERLKECIVAENYCVLNECFSSWLKYSIYRGNMEP